MELIWNDALCRPHYPLESLTVVGGAVAVPGGDTARPDALDCASVKVCVFGDKPNFVSLLRLKRRCCAFFTTLSVWVDHFSLSVMCTLRNLTFHIFHYYPVDVDRGLLPLLFPEVHNHPEGEVSTGALKLGPRD